MSLLVFGCSSSTTNEANTGGQAGMAGQAGAAGSNTGGANTGGVGNTGGSNIGGEAGNPSGGSGGGDSGVGGTGGGGGTGGVCVPKTCATFSYEKTGKTDLACGVIQDGCGNVVDCGGCSPFYSCNGNLVKGLGPGDSYPMTSEELQVPNTNITNICNGGCSTQGLGITCNSGEVLVGCPYFTSGKTPTTSIQGHKFSNCKQYSSTTLLWCCNL